MTVEEFIEKRGLSPITFPDWKPAMLLMRAEDGGDEFDDRYEFYANGDKTVWGICESDEEPFPNLLLRSSVSLHRLGERRFEF